MRRRVRRAKRFPTSTVLWTLLILNVGIGLAYSPVTALRKVRLVGADRSDVDRIERHLQSLRAVPWTQANRHAVESLVLDNESIGAATLETNLFGRGLLRVAQRVPVARLNSDRPIYLSDSGTLFASSRPVLGLPQVTIPVECLGPNLSIGGAWASLPIADLCERITKELPKNDWSVVVNSRGVINLEGKSMAKVVLGDADSLSKKLAKLKQILQENQVLVQKASAIILTSPDNPMFVPKKD